MKATWIFRRVRRGMRHRPMAIMTLVGAFALLTVLAGATRLSSQVTAALAPEVADNVHIIAYLADDASTERVSALMGLVREVPGVKDVRLVDSQLAYARLRGDLDKMGGASELLAGMEEGFLPRSIEVALEPSAALSERAQRMAASFRRFDGVTEVDAMEDGLAGLRGLIGAVRWLGWGLFALALLAGLTVLTLPLLRGRAERAEEAAILTMLGESPRHIRLPWSLIGAGCALIGSLVGIFWLYMGFGALVGVLGDSLGRLPDVATRFLPPLELGVGVGLAVLLGFFLGRRSIPLPDPRHA